MRNLKIKIQRNSRQWGKMKYLNHDTGIFSFDIRWLHCFVSSIFHKHMTVYAISIIYCGNLWENLNCNAYAHRTSSNFICFQSDDGQIHGLWSGYNGIKEADCNKVYSNQSVVGQQDYILLTKINCEQGKQSKL